MHFENYEIHENIIISLDNHENQENIKIIARITKIFKIINFMRAS